MRCSESLHCCVTTKQAQSSEKEGIFELSLPSRLSSSFCERHSDELRRICRLDLYQYAALAGGGGILKCRSYVADICDGLSADIENDVAGLQAALRRRTVGVDPCNDQALSGPRLPLRSRVQG